MTFNTTIQLLAFIGSSGVIIGVSMAFGGFVADDRKFTKAGLEALKIGTMTLIISMGLIIFGCLAK